MKDKRQQGIQINIGGKLIFNVANAVFWTILIYFAFTHLEQMHKDIQREERRFHRLCLDENITCSEDNFFRESAEGSWTKFVELCTMNIDPRWPLLDKFLAIHNPASNVCRSDPDYPSFGFQHEYYEVAQREVRAVSMSEVTQLMECFQVTDGLYLAGIEDPEQTAMNIWEAAPFYQWKDIKAVEGVNDIALKRLQLCY